MRPECEESNIPFKYGVLIYILTYLKPWSDEVRNTEDGWVNPTKWVFSNVDSFKVVIEEADKETNDTNNNPFLVNYYIEDNYVYSYYLI